MSSAPFLPWGVPGDHENANAETNEVAIVPRDLSDEAASGISKRAIDSFFKIHVANGAGRVLGIIFIDYVINQLLGNHEDQRPIVATHFENGANPFKTAQNAIFDFSTKVVSGVIDLGLDASGTAVSVVSTAGIELGNLVVAKALHIFNDKNQKIGSVSI
ncbi:hypothetical protein LZL87_012202 [Fusarium oxysporum]|nr:hypothetical protein LZL87_012202 [Fusarium oxysporum]